MYADDDAERKVHGFVATYAAIELFAQLQYSDAKVLMCLVRNLKRGQFVVNKGVRTLAKENGMWQQSFSRSKARLVELGFVLQTGRKGIAVNPKYIYVGEYLSAVRNQDKYDAMKKAAEVLNVVGQ